MVTTYEDLNGATVELTFGDNPRKMEARHVLVVVKHEGKWLMTRHKERGIEFPGGKAEAGESIEEAAIRETIEETGVVLKDLQKFAEYVVISNVTFCKAVFTGTIEHIHDHPQLYETEGALFLTDDELNKCEELSFHMKDEGMPKLRKWVDEHAG